MKQKFQRGELPKAIKPTEELIRERVQKIKERIAEGELNLGDSADNDSSLNAVNLQLSMEERSQIDYSRKIFHRISTKEELEHAAQNKGQSCMICFGDFTRRNKQVQCVFCSRCCCSQCCHRLRVNPQAQSKSQSKALICDDCERQYLTILLSHDFYQEETLLKAVNSEIEKDIGELKQQAEQEQLRIKRSKEIKESPEVLKRMMRLANLKKEVTESKKDLDRLDKQYATSQNELSNLMKERDDRKQRFSEMMQQKQRRRADQLFKLEELRRVQQERIKQLEIDEKERVQRQQRQQEIQAELQKRRVEQSQQAERTRMEEQMRQMALQLQREKENKLKLQKQLEQKERLDQERLDRMLKQRLEQQRIQQLKLEQEARLRQQEQIRLENERKQREVEQQLRRQAEKKNEWERQEQNRLRLIEQARLEEEAEELKRRASVVASEEQRDRERLMEMFTNPEDQSRRNSRYSVVAEPEKHISEILTSGEASILSFRVKPNKQPVFQASEPQPDKRQPNGSPPSLKSRSTEQSPAIIKQERAPAEVRPLTKEEILRSNSEIPHQEDMETSHLDQDSKCKCVLF